MDTCSCVPVIEYKHQWEKVMVLVTIGEDSTAWVFFTAQ